MDSLYVTMIATAGRANKLVTIKDGKPKKQAGPPISEGAAQTTRLGGLDDLNLVLAHIGQHTNMVLSLGCVPGTEPPDGACLGEPYQIRSREKLAEILGVDADDHAAIDRVHHIDGQIYTTRTLNVMRPGGLMLFDRDITPGMPDAMANMTETEWFSAMAEIMPGFDKVKHVKLPSTTGRVLWNGEPLEANGAHYYMRVADPRHPRHPPSGLSFFPQAAFWMTL
jgi:hypothetical protein